MPDEMRLQVFIDIKGCRSRHFNLRFTVGPNIGIIKYSVINKVHLCITGKFQIHRGINSHGHPPWLEIRPIRARALRDRFHAWKRDETRAWSKVTWKRWASKVTIYFSLLKAFQDNPFLHWLDRKNSTRFWANQMPLALQQLIRRGWYRTKKTI